MTPNLNNNTSNNNKITTKTQHRGRINHAKTHRQNATTINQPKSKSRQVGKTTTKTQGTRHKFDVTPNTKNRARNKPKQQKLGPERHKANHSKP